MASGFPDTPNRTAFGPTFQDKRPVVDPTKELGSQVFNLMAWQMAGAGIVCPRAMIIYDGSTPATTYQALAWDPNGLLGNISITKQGTGEYDVDFASTYTDQNGTAVSFSVRGAMAFGQDAPSQVQAVVTIGEDSPQQVTVYVGNQAGTPQDATVLILVW